MPMLRSDWLHDKYDDEDDYGCMSSLMLVRH